MLGCDAGALLESKVVHTVVVGCCRLGLGVLARDLHYKTRDAGASVSVLQS